MLLLLLLLQAKSKGGAGRKGESMQGNGERWWSEVEGIETACSIVYAEKLS